MHGDRRLTGARHSLYDHIVIGRFSDDLILLLLNGSNDFSQHCLLVFCQVFCQKIVICHNLCIIKIKQLSFFDLIGSLQFQINFHLCAVRCGIAAFSKSVLVVGIGNRCTPVGYHIVSGVLCDATFTDINGLLLIKSFIMKHDSSEIGFVFCFLISFQGTFHMVMQSDGIV